MECKVWSFIQSESPSRTVTDQKDRRSNTGWLTHPSIILIMIIIVIIYGYNSDYIIVMTILIVVIIPII